MSEVANRNVKASWNGDCLYLPDDESISYFPMKVVATEPKVSNQCSAVRQLFLNLKEFIYIHIMSVT